MGETNGHKQDTTIPVISFAEFNSSSPQAGQRVATRLVNACIKYGFAYITDHGVPDKSIQEAFAMSKSFFDLSVDDKMKAPHPPGYEVNTGYSWPGLEKVSNAVGIEKGGEGDGANNGDIAAQIASLREVQDVKESFDMYGETNKEQPNRWLPEDVLPGFREFMVGFYDEMNSAAQQVLQALALGLLSCQGSSINHIDEDTFVKLHTGIDNQLRLLHYPPIPISELHEYAEGTGTKVRMPAHSDWSTITLLFQDSVGGLEVEVPEGGGTFMPVRPLKQHPYAMVMNVGDLMMRWSGDILKSTEHRVGLPPPSATMSNGHNEGSTTQARYSIVYFLTTDPDQVIECIVGNGNGQEGKAKYEPITQREYGAMRRSMQY